MINFGLAMQGVFRKLMNEANGKRAYPGSGAVRCMCCGQEKCRGEPRHKFIGGITEWLCVAGAVSGAVPVIIHSKS
jgi:hypothetical protein